jgi:branched-chain amino acid transport system permease protein
MNQVIDTILIGLSNGSIYALISLALVLVWRSTRVINFAQVGQAMLATYIGFEVATRSGIFWFGLLFAIVAGALVGAGVDYFFMRVLFRHATSGPAAVVAPVIATLGLLGLIRSVVGLIWSSEYRIIEPPVSPNGITIGERVLPFSPLNALTIISVLATMLVLSFFFSRSNLGLALRASAYAPEIARTSGIKTGQMRTIGWAIAGGLGGLAGMLITSFNFLTPNSLDVYLIFGFIAAVIGGIDSLVGAVVGALILGIFLTAVLNLIGSSAVFIFALLLLLLVLFVKPEGLFGKGGMRRA